MATTEALEIYKQRYDTYRHLDKLRWQMFQIAVGAGSVVLAFGRGESSDPDWWVLGTIGLLLVIFGLVMERIRQGISMNGIVLEKVGKIVGDADIPPASRWWESISFWIAFGLIALGISSLVLAARIP